MLSVVPVVRAFKLLRNFEKFHLLLRAFERAFEALPVLLYIFFMMILFFASLIYIVEPRDNIQTLPKGLWYAMVTMTTVGYGDVVPETSQGKIVACGLMVCSALYMALPLGLVGASFSEVWAERDVLLVKKRTRDRLIQSGYTAHDIPALFAVFDTNKTGELTLVQFSKMIKQMNVFIDTERLLKLFNLLDRNQGGTIDEQEFVRIIFPDYFVQVFGDDNGQEFTEYEDAG